MNKLNGLVPLPFAGNMGIHVSVFIQNSARLIHTDLEHLAVSSWINPAPLPPGQSPLKFEPSSSELLL